MQDAKEYEENRSKNKKSAYEEKNLTGMKELTKALRLYKSQIRRTLDGTPTLGGLYKYQLFVILKLFSPRNGAKNA